VVCRFLYFVLCSALVTNKYRYLITVYSIILLVLLQLAGKKTRRKPSCFVNRPILMKRIWLKWLATWCVQCGSWRRYIGPAISQTSRVYYVASTRRLDVVRGRTLTTSRLCTASVTPTSATPPPARRDRTLASDGPLSQHSLLPSSCRLRVPTCKLHLLCWLLVDFFTGIHSSWQTTRQFNTKNKILSVAISIGAWHNIA